MQMPTQTTVRCALTALATVLMVAVGPVRAAGRVYSPEAGVICDVPAGFCADGTGVSATWTEKHLGPAAARKLAAIMTDPAGFDGTVFGFSNRVYCRIETRVCTRSKLSSTIDPSATRTLFGKLPH